MGYNSEVGLLFNKEAVALMDADVRKAIDRIFETVRSTDDGCLLCHADNTKWDDEIEDVDIIHSFMRDLDVQSQASCEMLRLGDDDDDNDRRLYGNSGACQLWFERTISLQGEPLADKPYTKESVHVLLVYKKGWKPSQAIVHCTRTLRDAVDKVLACIEQTQSIVQEERPALVQKVRSSLLTEGCWKGSDGTIYSYRCEHI